MSIHPVRLEARVSAQERLLVILNARIEEVAQDLEELKQDMDTSFKQLVEYHIATENIINERFDQVEMRLDKVDERFDQVETRLDRIEATMATKEDLTATENRILDAVKQLIATINPQQPPQ